MRAMAALASRVFTSGRCSTGSFADRGSLARSGGMTDGRDIGVVHLLPRRERGTVLPASGDVGAQYSPGAGWAQPPAITAAASQPSVRIYRDPPAGEPAIALMSRYWNSSPS